MAGSTGLEPATSGLTGRRSNQLNYDPAFGWDPRRPSFTERGANGGRYWIRTSDPMLVKRLVKCPI